MPRQNLVQGLARRARRLWLRRELRATPIASSCGMLRRSGLGAGAPEYAREPVARFQASSMKVLNRWGLTFRQSPERSADCASADAAPDRSNWPGRYHDRTHVLPASREIRAPGSD